LRTAGATLKFAFAYRRVLVLLMFYSKLGGENIAES
jgi:hypothetical protein